MDWGKCAQATDVTGTTWTVASLQCLPVLFGNILTALFMFSGTIAAFMIIVSGFRLMLAGGEAKQIETARKTLLYAVAGLFLILFSYLILNIIAYVTGVQCILTFGPFDPLHSCNTVQ